MVAASESSYPAVVDLFCGAGGLSYGLQKAGVTVVAGIDIDPVCRHPFEANVAARFHVRDIAEVSAEFVASLYPEADPRVLAGCAPCQPFSSYTRGGGTGGGRWGLVDKFGALVAELKPEVVTMENVPRLTGRSVFERFLSVLREAGYQYTHSVVRCAAYGVPQTRSRLVLLASQLGRIDLAAPTHPDSGWVTVRDTIGHLESIPAGGTGSSDALHRASGLSEQNLRRIREAKAGGTWRDWDETLRAPCHTRPSGRTYPGVYGRMEWDRPAPTITTQFHGFGNGRFGHPDQDRAISLREGALLQTFPADYSFVPEGTSVKIGPVARLIGNAVPVKLGEAIGRSIMDHLKEKS
ncbi:MAG: DNA cytosine methyltransferase [bacterium]|nr:DNA cytosine methyltransferase [bacterium]MDE0290882.1 DNA cytosine methyltransferase [bacterium]MDE0439787.1 DNA cytosine methyltransferase [bacterium]